MWHLPMIILWHRTTKERLPIRPSHMSLHIACAFDLVLLVYLFTLFGLALLVCVFIWVFLLQRPMIKNCFGTTVDLLVVLVALVICTNTNLGILLGPLTPSRSSLVCVQCVIMRLRFFRHLLLPMIILWQHLTKEGATKTFSYVHAHCMRIWFGLVGDPLLSCVFIWGTGRLLKCMRLFLSYPFFFVALAND